MLKSQLKSPSSNEYTEYVWEMWLPKNSWVALAIFYLSLCNWVSWLSHLIGTVHSSLDYSMELFNRRDEQSDRPKSKASMELFFWGGLPLGPIQPSSPSTIAVNDYSYPWDPDRVQQQKLLRDPRFESIHLQILLAVLKSTNKNRPGMAHSFDLHTAIYMWPQCIDI